MEESKKSQYKYCRIVKNRDIFKGLVLTLA